MSAAMLSLGERIASGNDYLIDNVLVTTGAIEANFLLFRTAVADLWQRLLELTQVHDVTWAWTRGHAGHEQNEIVDSLALSARRRGRGTEN